MHDRHRAQPPWRFGTRVLDTNDANNANDANDAIMIVVYVGWHLSNGDADKFVAAVHRGAENHAGPIGTAATGRALSRRAG
jgi:hypothetical protein